MNRNSIVYFDNKLLLILSIIFFHVLNIYPQESVKFQNLEKRVPVSTIEASTLDLTREKGNSGNVSFSIPLIKIGDVGVQLDYSSEGVFKQVRTENQYAPAGSVGLGWKLSVGTISAEINNSEDPSDDKYYYTGTEGNFEIIEDEDGVFHTPEDKVWKIEREMAGQKIIGWKITKEDGTIMRFGNYYRNTNPYTFSLTNDSTFATRSFLGYDGLVINPGSDYYPDLYLIPYQWDLSDIEDTFGNHTRIIYSPELVSLSVTNGSTTTTSSAQYTRSSHISKIIDNNGNIAEFNYQDLTAGEYPSFPQTYSQNLVDKSRLLSIKLYGNAVNETGELYKTISLASEPVDIFNLGINKRYLSGISILDKSNNSLPGYSFSYYTESTSNINPGALKTITYPKGGEITYTYKTQTLSNIELSKKEAVSSIDYWDNVYNMPNDDGLSGKDFIVVRLADNTIKIYKQTPSGWMIDPTFPATLQSEHTNTYNDYITFWTENGGNVLKQTHNGWQNYDLADSIFAQTGYNASDFQVIAVAQNYFIVKHNNQLIDNTEETYNQYNLSIVEFCPKGLKIYHLVEPNTNDNYFYEGFDPENVSASIKIKAFIGDNSLLVQSYIPKAKDPAQNIGLRYSLFMNNNSWVGYPQTQYSDWNISSIPSVFMNKNFLAFRTIYGIRVVKLSAGDTDFQSPVDVISVVGNSNGDNFSPKVLLGDDYYIYNYYDAGEHIVIRKWNGSSFTSIDVNALINPSTTLFECDFNMVGNNLVLSWTDYSSTPSIRKLGYIRYNPVSSEWSSLNIIDTHTINAATIDGPFYKSSSMAINSNSFYTLWFPAYPLSTTCKAELKVYSFQGNLIQSKLAASIPIQGTPLEEDPLKWVIQPGNNFIAMSKPSSMGSSGGVDSIAVYTMIQNSDGSLSFNDNPQTVVIDKKTFNNKNGDTFQYSYLYENGAFNESLNTSYNKVTEALSGKGKTINYFYNDIEYPATDGFISAVNYKELDGLSYLSQDYNESNSLIQQSTSHWTGVDIKGELGVFFKRLDSKETTLDGVTSSTNYVYNDVNHLPSRTTENVGVLTSTGSGQNKITEVTYAYENNPGMNTNHMLVQPFETRIYESGNTTTPVSRNQTVYSGTYPYVLTDVKQWDGSDWLTTSGNIKYDTKGNMIQSTDANGSTSSIIWGYKSYLPVAQVLNAQTSTGKVGAQASYVGFETGSISDGTNPDEDYWSFYPDQNVSTDSHTGKYSWQIHAGNPVYGPTRDFLPPNDIAQNKTYIFSCWVKTESGFGDNKGQLVIHSKNNTDDNNNSVPATGFDEIKFKSVSFGDTQGKWKYIEVALDLAAVRSAAGITAGDNLRIRAYPVNNDPGKYFLVDDIRFYPKDAVMQTFTYDPVTSLVTSQSDPNGNPVYLNYDGFGRPTATYNYANELVSLKNYPNPTTENTTLSQYPAANGFTQIIMDGFGKKLQQNVQTDGADLTTTWSYSKGQLSVEQVPSGYATQYLYNTDLLGRIEKQGGLNSSVWNNTTGRHTSFSYGANAASEVSGYSAGKLFKTIVTDENNKIKYEYKDLLGNVVQSIDNIATPRDLTSENLTTNFQYNILGSITSSVSPMGFATTYSYNGLNRLTQKISPDAGTVQYMYDANGNIRFVKDANQQHNSKYSYNKYDSFNRVIEKGEITLDNTFTQPSASNIDFPINNFPYKVLSEQLYYDYPCDAIEQNNVKGKIAKSISYRQGTAICTTYYSYNQAGLVEWVLYKMPGSISDKKVSYEYDRQGKVIKKCVTDLASNTLYTYYNYDMAGRLKYVYTNTIDGESGKVKEAEYTYNADGTLKRLQLANAQGVDYQYNERSWLTQINHENMEPADDPGHDDESANGVAGDKFAEVIGYNTQGYIAAGTGFNWQPQYNGNISWAITRTKGAELPGIDAGVSDPMIGYVFSYDGANRLIKADFGYKDESSGWSNNLANAAMYELPLINYDANGNIRNMQRNNKEAVLSDNFSYAYAAGNNRLASVTNAAAGNAVYNYSYDYNGNVTADQLEGISGVVYNSSNLPEQLTANNTDVNYWYNGDGQRIRKQAEDVDELYVYGVDGQTEAVFEANGSLKFFNINTGKENLGRIEAAAYELRLANATLNGTYTGNNIIAETNVNVTGTVVLKAGISVTLKPGFKAAAGCSLKVTIDNTLIVVPQKYYYVKDHIGSTRVTVKASGEIAATYDYDPWGMLLDGRNSNFGISNEKYKFTGKERDDETNYDYFGARYYDSRIGRWLQVDPSSDEAIDKTSYGYVSNNPLSAFDPDGNKEWLLTWLPNGEHPFGHSAIAIQIWKDGKPTGQIKIRDFSPKKTPSLGQEVESKSINETRYESEVETMKIDQGRPADGIIEISGDEKQDNIVNSTLDKLDGTKYEPEKKNCSNYTSAPFKALGIDAGKGATVTVESSINSYSTKMLIPASVHNALKNSGDKRIKILKELPKKNGNPNLTFSSDFMSIYYLKRSRK